VEAELVALRILHHRPPVAGVAPELDKAGAGAGHALHLIVELLLPDGYVEVDPVLDELVRYAVGLCGMQWASSEATKNVSGDLITNECSCNAVRHALGGT
jgi:hypothetical protein